LVSILYFFIDLCLLRRAPQDLPGSPVLLGLVLVAAFASSALVSVSAGAGLALALIQAALDLALLMVVLHTAMRMLDRLPRFLQTATAMAGADALIGLVALLPLMLAGPVVESGGAPGATTILAGLLFLVLVVWSILVSAHILRHAFDITLGQGAFIAVAYDLIAFVLVGGLIETPTS
jgi:hypothetical protein